MSPIQPAVPPTSAGWEARLDLALRAEDGRTRLVSRAHRGPLVVQRPFWPEGDVCHLYLVHPPGGIVSGDHLRLELQATHGAHALVTTPAATKFYRARAGEPARLVQNLQVADAALEWLPQETLVFNGARARARTRVMLAGTARFIGWEVLCLGRPAADELFASGDIAQDFELWHGEQPLLLDRLRLAPGPALQAPWGLDGATALGSLLAWPAQADALDAVRALQDDTLACTLVDKALLVRTLAAQGEVVRQRLLRVWQALRPRLLGRPPVSPRIWAT
jgi:urease accessory protein